MRTICSTVVFVIAAHIIFLVLFVGCLLMRGNW